MQVHKCVFVINQLNFLSCHLYYGTYKTLFDFFCYFYKHFLAESDRGQLYPVIFRLFDPHCSVLIINLLKTQTRF